MSLLTDLRLGLRFLTRTPGFFALSSVTLALGIGAATLMFSITESVLWRPLPLPHPEQLVMLIDREIKNPSNNTGASAADFLDWRARAHSFAGLGALRSGAEHTLTGTGERVRTQTVTAGFFEMLGVRPALGREFAPGEESPANRGVVLTDEFWHSHFSGAMDAVGRTFALDREAYTVIGVLPTSFRLADIVGFPDHGIFVASDFPNAAANRSNRSTSVIARLRPDVSRETAAAEMHSIAARIAAENPREDGGWDVHIDDLREAFTHYNASVLYLFFGFSVLVLLIASANAGGLGLVRSVSRQREYAVRLALGAGSAELRRLALAEAFWIALPSSIGGVLLAAWGLQGVLYLMPPTFLTRADQISLDYRALLFVMLVSISITAFAAVIPTLFAVGPRIEAALRAGSKSVAASPGTQVLLNGLIAAEMALSLVLLFAAGLFLSSNARLEQVELGFNPHHLVTANITASGARAASPAQQAALFSEAMRRVQAIGGVQQVAFASAPPLNGGDWLRYTTGGRTYARRDLEPSSLVRVVSPEFFPAVGVRLLLGRALEARDSAAAMRVAVVNENLANSAFPGQDPIGKSLEIHSDDPSIPSGPVEIVGLAANMHELSLNEVPFEDVFLPFAQNPRRSGSLVAKYAGAPGPVAEGLRSELKKLDADSAVYGIQTMDETVVQGFRGPRFRMSMVSLFAALAVLLAGVGIYGVIAFSVAQRTREFALRIALGALPGSIRRIAVVRTTRLTVVAAAVGLTISLALGRLLESELYLVPHQHSGVLYGVSVHDPLSLGGAAAILLAIALGASLIPASRAANVEPSAELRND